MVWKLLVPHLRIWLAVLLSIALWSVPAGAQQAASPLIRSYGETIYIPAYSHVFTSEKQKQPLASTLIVHNVDPELTIELTSVRYYDDQGRVVEAFVRDALDVGPFATRSFLVGISEDPGSIGVNFVVEWRADQAALSPVSEAVMIGGTGTQGLSFTSVGKVIARRFDPGK